MRYFLTGIILSILGLSLMITSIEKLYQIFPQIPSSLAPRIGGCIALVIGIFLLVVQIAEWSGKL